MGHGSGSNRRASQGAIALHIVLTRRVVRLRPDVDAFTGLIRRQALLHRVVSGKQKPGAVGEYAARLVLVDPFTLIDTAPWVTQTYLASWSRTDGAMASRLPISWGGSHRANVQFRNQIWRIAWMSKRMELNRFKDMLADGQPGRRQINQILPSVGIATVSIP